MNSLAPRGTPILPQNLWKFEILPYQMSTNTNKLLLGYFILLLIDVDVDVGTAQHQHAGLSVCLYCFPNT